MAPLKFVDSHNMVAFLTKSAESEGFEQIVDFLKANPIKYALTINPIIYTSCIEQFWATVKVKTVNEEMQLQALVDRKKVIITEASVRRDLQLEDAEGIECLPNAVMFEQLALMRYYRLQNVKSAQKVSSVRLILSGKDIQRGNGSSSVSTDTNGLIKVLPPKTAEETLARERERKARTTLLMALPEDHLAKFHKMTDAKEILRFSVSNSEGLHKGYDRFQSLLSQLEIHGAGVSTEDANQKFLRSLPSAWSQVSLIMRTKPGVDSLSFDDLYNNLRVFESDVKGSTASSSSTQNVAFVSENTSSTNDVSTAYGVSNSSGHNSQYEHTSSYSLLANQSSCPQLDHEDLEQLDEFDLEEMDLKWQVAMICMRMKKFYKSRHGIWLESADPRGIKMGGEEMLGTLGKRKKDNGRRSGKQEDSKALVTINGEGVDWTSHSEDEQENYAFMACNSSGSDTEGIQAGLGYGDQLNKGVLSYENEVFQSVFVSRTSETENSPVNDRYAEGMHQSKPSESNARRSDFTSCESNTNEETHESMPETVVNEPTVVSQPKVWNDAPIIEEYESDSEDEHVSLPSKEQETPIFANTIKHIKTPRQTVKQQNTGSKSPKPDKKDCSGLMYKKSSLGYGYTRKACFVCDSFSHLIRDCDFHEKRMAKQAEVNKRMCKGTGQRENRPVWNNVNRVNHQNQFVPTAILTRDSSTNNVNTVRASSTK
ncbi:hypothetical protein Tco_0514787, partial [Tanacetum coccineum]